MWRLFFYTLVIFLCRDAFANADQADDNTKLKEAYSHYLKGDLVLSIKLYTEVIKNNSLNREAYAGRGISLLTHGRYDESISDLTKSLDLGLSDHLCYYNRGLAFQHKDEYKKAIEDYTKCLEIKKDFFWAIVNRGAAYHQNGQDDKALRDLLEAKKINENVDELLCLLGDVYLKYKNYNESLCYYLKSLAITSDKPYVLVRISEVKRILGSDEGSINDLLEAVSKNNDYLNFVMDRALLYASLKKYELSERIFGELIRKFPKNPTLYAEMGSIYYKTKKYQKAIDNYSKALDLNPESINILVNRAESYFNINKMEKCIADCSQCIEKNKLNAKVYEIRGAAYDKMGNKTQAVDDFATAKLLKSSK